MLLRCFLIFLYLYPFTAADAAIYRADGDVVGEISRYRVKKDDNLPKIARQFDVGIIELLAANPDVTPRTLKAGMRLIIPAMHILPWVRHGIVLNLAELRLFYFVDEHTVMTFPVGIGKEGWETPTGSTVVLLKRKDPVWIPPDSIREENPNLPDIVPAGPHNPLGAYALNLGMPGYRIHGTNSPYSVGKRVSHGCIRMYPEDIEALFNAVTEGTSVVITNNPYKIGWKGKVLFLEVMPTSEQADAIAKYQSPVSLEPEKGIEESIRYVAAEHPVSIDWQAVKRSIVAHTEVPSPIGKRF